MYGIICILGVPSSTQHITWTKGVVVYRKKRCLYTLLYASNYFSRTEPQSFLPRKAKIIRIFCILTQQIPVTMYLLIRSTFFTHNPVPLGISTQIFHLNFLRSHIHVCVQEGTSPAHQDWGFYRDFFQDFLLFKTFSYFLRETT